MTIGVAKYDGMNKVGSHRAVVIAAFAIWGCTTTPSPSVAPMTSVFDFPVDCGPIQDAALCDKAVMVAATARLNPPPIAGGWIRLDLIR